MKTAKAQAQRATAMKVPEPKDGRAAADWDSDVADGEDMVSVGCRG